MEMRSVIILSLRPHYIVHVENHTNEMLFSMSQTINQETKDIIRRHYITSELQSIILFILLKFHQLENLEVMEKQMIGDRPLIQ